MKMPLVSVIMPCYNHSRFLNDSINSIINQTYSNFELIIIDDFSYDNSKDIIKHYVEKDKRVKEIFHNNNMGASKSRNDAIKISKGKYIAFCDSDDIWDKKKLEYQINLLENNTNFDICHSDSFIIDENGHYTGKLFSNSLKRQIKLEGYLFKQFCIKNCVNMQTAVHRRKCINNITGFQENIKYVEDWIYWLELSKRHLFCYIKEPLGKYRVHSNSSNLDVINLKYEGIKGYEYILKKYPELDDKLKSKINYEMGISFYEIGNTNAAREKMIESFSLNRKNIKSLIRLILPQKKIKYSDSIDSDLATVL